MVDLEKRVMELVFIMDRSGSMSGRENDTIGGFNSLIKEQQKDEDKVNVTTVLFDDKTETLYDRVDLNTIKEMTRADYYARGCTALYDAIGKTINYIDKEIRKDLDDKKPNRVMVVITTDGFENASREYNHHQIREMIETYRRKYDWEFVFLGANIDSYDVASNIGIDKKNVANVYMDKDGQKAMYDSLNVKTRAFKECRDDSDWKKIIENDEKQRKNK